MKNVILEEKAKGKTIILTTHNIQDAQELCDRVAFIVRGRIMALDTLHILILQKGVGSIRYTWLENGLERTGECTPNKTGADKRLCGLVGEGRILTIHSAEPNFGDIFMEITGRALLYPPPDKGIGNEKACIE